MWSKLGTTAIMAAFLAGTAALAHAQAAPTPGVTSSTTIGAPGTGYHGGFANGYGTAPGRAGMASPGMAASGTTAGAPAVSTPGTGYYGGNGYGTAPGRAGMASPGPAAGWGGGGIGGAPTSGQGSNDAGVGTAG